MEERIENIILIALAELRPVLIDGVATISLCRVGSRLVNPKIASDFPHLELVVTAPNGGLSLLEKLGEEAFNQWLSSVSISKGKNTIIKIKDCFTLKVKGEKISILSIEQELKLILNPFATLKNDKKKRGSSGYIWGVIITLLAAAFCAYYFYFSDLENKKNNQIVLEKHSQVIADSIASVIREQAIKDSLANIVPVDIVDYFVVVGSYPNKYYSTKDSVRLVRIIKDEELKSFIKKDEKIINYIFSSTDKREAERQLYFKSKKYPIIKGMWIYEQKR